MILLNVTAPFRWTPFREFRRVGEVWVFNWSWFGVQFLVCSKEAAERMIDAFSFRFPESR